MMHIDNFQDFIKAHADAAGMTREEFMAVLMSENTTIQEGLSKSAIKKQIKVIDKQIEDEEGGDGEPLTSETLQDLERERERLLALIESVVTEAALTIPGMAAMLLGLGIAARIGFMSDEKYNKMVGSIIPTAKAIIKTLPIIGNKVRNQELKDYQTKEVEKYLKDEISDKDIVAILNENPKLKKAIEDVATSGLNYKDYYQLIKELGGAANKWGDAHRKFKQLRKKISDGKVLESVNEEVAYNSSNTKPEAAKQATKEFGKLLPKANKGVEPYVFAVVKTKARNYRLAIKSGSYVAHEFMSGLKEDGILTADIVKKAVANVIKLNPEEFNESVVTEGKDDRSHIILRVEPRNYDNMVDKLQDMRVNHNQESKNTIKVYTDKTSGWYGNSKAQYKLTHDVWVDKFVINEASQEAYILHRLADNPGEAVAGEFLSNHNVDLGLLTKAIQQKTINKYELRDIVNGTAHKFKIKNFMKDFVTEGTYNSKDHIGDTSDGQGSNAEIYKKGKGYYVVVSGEFDYDFTAKNDKELLQKLKDNEFDNTDIIESMTLGFSSQDFRRNSLNEAEKAKGDRSAIDDDAIETGLKKKATESGVPISLLRLVMRRGMEAWNSSHRPGTTKQQWGYARLNAFLEKGKGTWQGADADIAKEVRDSNKDSKLPIKNPSQYTKKERES